MRPAAHSLYRVSLITSGLIIAEQRLRARPRANVPDTSTPLHVADNSMGKGPIWVGPELEAEAGGGGGGEGPARERGLIGGSGQDRCRGVACTPHP